MFESLEERRLMSGTVAGELAMDEPMTAEPTMAAPSTATLDRTFIKSWSTSGDADDRPTEEVSFYYNKIAFQYGPTSDGK